MKKAQPPLLAELSLVVTEDSTSPVGKFAGTVNPRQLRVIAALLHHPLTRKDVDRIAGCTNGPALIAELRRLGLGMEHLRSECKDGTDQDGRPCRFGMYSLTPTGIQMVRAWLRSCNEAHHA